jgi:CBS domain-containing protein
VSETASLLTVINRLETQSLNQITVLSPAGAVAGVIDRGDIIRAVAKSLGGIIPETEIQRLKAEGGYPPGLPLGEIAKKTDSSDPL